MCRESTPVQATFHVVSGCDVWLLCNPLPHPGLLCTTPPLPGLLFTMPPLSGQLYIMPPLSALLFTEPPPFRTTVHYTPHLMTSMHYTLAPRTTVHYASLKEHVCTMPSRTLTMISVLFASQHHSQVLGGYHS